MVSDPQLNDVQIQTSHQVKSGSIESLPPSPVLLSNQMMAYESGTATKEDITAIVSHFDHTSLEELLPTGPLPTQNDQMADFSLPATNTDANKSSVVFTKVHHH